MYNQTQVKYTLKDNKILNQIHETRGLLCDNDVTKNLNYKVKSLEN